MQYDGKPKIVSNKKPSEANQKMEYSLSNTYRPNVTEQVGTQVPRVVNVLRIGRYPGQTCHALTSCDKPGTQSN